MSSSKLWIPNSAKELLAVDLNDASNATEDEFQRMLFINQSITDWLNSRLDTGTLTDILSQYDVEPETLDDCEDYVHILHQLGNKVS